jgi:transglutaminase-like putative cysteine protease
MVRNKEILTHIIFYLVIILVLAVSACQTQKRATKPVRASPVTVTSQREYRIRQELILTNNGPAQPKKQNLWVALIHDVPPYQEVRSSKISPNNYEIITDEYGNQYAEFDFSGQPVGKTITIQIEYQVIVNELVYDLSVCEGNLLTDFTQPELHIESANVQIIALAKKLSRGQPTVCQQVRAFYDYIGNELVYTYNSNDWGAQAALGPMGADCTEYASLLAALSRAQKIPARYFEGLLFLDSDTQDLARVEHAWTDIYMPGIGWTAVDPTLGRALLNRETYFAHYTPEHIIVTLGRNPSTLRGSSYWTHLYWPGNSTKIHVEAKKWEIELIKK